MISFDINKIPAELMAKLSPDFHLLLEEQKRISRQENIDRVMSILDELSSGNIIACSCDAASGERFTLCRNEHNHCNTGENSSMKGIAHNIDYTKDKPYVPVYIGKITDVYELNDILQDVNLGCILVVCNVVEPGPYTCFKASYHINGMHGYDFDTIKKLCESVYDEYPQIFTGVDNYMSNLLLINKGASKEILKHTILSNSALIDVEKNITQVPSRELIDALESISSGPVYGCKCDMRYDVKVDMLCKLRHACCYVGSEHSIPYYREYTKNPFSSKTIEVGRNKVEKIITLSEIDNMLAAEGMKCTLVVDTNKTELSREYNISYNLGDDVYGFEFKNVRDMEKTPIFGEDFTYFVTLDNILVMTPTMSRTLKALSKLLGK